MKRESGAERWWRSGTAIVVWIAVGTVAAHLATGWRYGFDRDELMALEDARCLAWGYVQYPPMTAFFGWLALKLFGTSLGGFRFFAAVAQAVAVVLTGWMAKEMGGRNEIRNSKLDNRNPERETRNAGSDNRAAKDEIRKETAGGVKPPLQERGEWAAVVAALAAVPFCLGGGALMQYISFDYLCWVLVAYGMVKILGREVASDGNQKSENRNCEVRSTARNGCATSGWSLRTVEESESKKVNEWKSARGEGGKGAEGWWLVVGAGIGLGMMAKYTMLFLAAGVVAGVLLTRTRRYLRSGWLWSGVLVAVGIWQPNLWWQWQRNFVSLEFLRFLHERDVRLGLTDWFLAGQVEITLLAFPLAMAGLWWCFRGEKSRLAESPGARYIVPVHEEGDGGVPGGRWRVIGWMYLVPMILFVGMRGRDYYLAPAYPMLYAAGAVWLESKWREREESAGVEEYKSARGRVGGWMRRLVWVALAVDIVVAAAVALPIAPVNSRWWNLAVKVDPVFAEEIGWPDFVAGVARVRDGIPVEERGRLGILAGNYGEVGALNLYGEKYGLPRAISGVNSSWERGYGEPAPQTVIVVGYPRQFLEQYFASCEVAGRTQNQYGVANEEVVEHPEIFVCRGLRGSWGEFWRAARTFA